MSRNLTIAACMWLGGAALLAAPVSPLDRDLPTPAGLSDDLTRTSYFQDFESLAPGPLAGQGGWTGWGANIAVVTTAPISGQRSARHTSDGSGFPGFEVVGPAFTPAYGLLALNVRLSGTHVTYQVDALGDVPSIHDGTYYNTAVQFAPDGHVRVLQAQNGAAVYQNANAVWQPDVAFQIALEVLQSGTVNVYKNGALVFTGTEIGFAVDGTPGRTKQFLAWTDNLAGFAGESLTFDDFTNVLSALPGTCPGDMNCDGAITFGDVDAFVDALARAAGGPPGACPWAQADCNRDGEITFADIDPFVALIGTTCP
jgi:hypothetical protein